MGGRYQLCFQLGKRYARLLRVSSVVRQSRTKLCALGIGDKGRESLALRTVNQGLSQRAFIRDAEVF